MSLTDADFLAFWGLAFITIAGGASLVYLLLGRTDR